jgi:hypothetical protein
MDSQALRVDYDITNYGSLRKVLFGSDWRHRRIADEFEGDVQRFEEAFEKEVEYGRRDAVHWEDLLNGATILPEYEEVAEDLIERRLGYVPSKRVVLPFEPFLRALLKSHLEGHITDADFTAQAEEHITLIRNADMVINLCADYSPAIYRSYDTYCVGLKDVVKSRLTRFLRYEPALKHSLVGELWLREQMSKDTFNLGEEKTMLDIKVMTLIKYRQDLLGHSQEWADKSPLLGIGRAVV